MSSYAYWITPKGEILKPDIRHIGAIIRNPRKFGETDRTINATYEKHGEKISATIEGKAREEVMTRVIKRGFIRIRKGGSRSNQKWSIQLTKLNSRVNDYLWEWARKMIDSRVAIDTFADVHIHQLSNNKMTKTSLNKIADGGSITEDVRIYREDELHELEDYFDYAHRYFDLIHEDAQQELIDRGYTGHLINEGINLDESSLSRIFTHIRQGKRAFGVISPFRGELPKSENEERYKELKKAVRTLGYGFIEMQGGFKEEDGFTLEKSLFIPNISRKEIVDLGIKYDQYSVLYKDSDEFLEIGTNSNAGIKRVKNRFQFKDRNSLELAQDAMKDFFSKLIKGSHRGKKFLFKLQEKEVGSFNRLAYGQKPLKWNTIYEEHDA
jgi:hypothetical protein